MNDFATEEKEQIEALPFQKPQREASLGVLINFFHILIKQIRNGISIFILFFFLVRRLLDSVFYTISLGLLLTFILIVIISIFAYLQYKRLQFHIDYEQEEFHIEKGVMEKTTLVFKLDRIQQINITRNWLQRLLKLSALEIETAGSTEKEVSLKALSTETAQDLMQALMHYQKQQVLGKVDIENEDAQEIISETTEEKVITKIKFGNIIKYGFSINIMRGLLLIFLPLNYIYQSYSSFLYKQVEDLENYSKSLTFNQLTLLIIIVLSLSIALNVILSVFKFFGFVFLKKGEELKLNFGLVNLKSISLRPLRIQLLIINQNFLQKLWSIKNYRIFQFHGSEQKDLSIIIPGIQVSEQEQQVQEYIHFPKLAAPTEVIHPSIRMFFVNSIIHLILLSAPFIFFSLQDNYLPFYMHLLVFMIIALVIIFWNYRYYKNYELEVYDRYLIKKYGVWNKKTMFLDIYKIQTISVKQYLWQKRLQIGKLEIVTAGGSFDFNFADFKKLHEICNYSLYQIQAFPKKWM